MAAYSAYARDLKAGDRKAALKDAKIAYEAAETAWGASRRETALIATNYADMLFAAGRAKDAVPVYQRCVEIAHGLGAEAVGDEALCTLDLARAYVALKDREASVDAYTQAAALAEPLAQGNPAMAGVAADAYLGLAKDAADRAARASANRVARVRVSANFEVARDYGAKAEKLYALAGRGESGEAGLAAMFQGLYYENKGEWGAAAPYYERASTRISASDRFPKEMKDLMQGRYGYVSARGEDGKSEQYPKPAPKKPGCFIMEREGKAPVEVCLIGRKTPPRYPENQEYAGYSGFAIVEYDVSETGAVEKPRIVASWPGGAFDKASLKAARTWRYKPPVTVEGRKPARVEGMRVNIYFLLSDE